MTDTSGTTLTVPQITYETEGKKEDIEEIIGLISPYDTPCYSQFRKTTAIQPVHSWQEDYLRVPAAQAITEGQTTTVNTGVATVLKTNWTQIFEESAAVSGTMESTALYGRSDEMDYQMMKKGRELRRDIEFALVGNGQTGAVGSSSVARTLASCEALIGSDTTTDLSSADVTEAHILAIHQAMFQLGGDANQLMVTPGHSLRVANFAYIDPTAASQRLRDFGNESKLVNKVDVYISPFGTLSVVLNRWLQGPGVGAATDTSSMLLLETDRWSIPQLRPMTAYPLAKTGDNTRRLLNCELTLVLENEDASGIIINCNDA